MTGKLSLTGMTWDHPRGFESVVACNDLLEERFGVSVDWTARSLLEFGDQHIREFASDHDLMVIDHPHVPDGVHDGALLAMDDLLSEGDLSRLARESAGPSHESYRFCDKIWALAIDAATQVSVYRPDLVDGVPPFWDDILHDARQGKVLWPHKPVDAFSTFATLSAQMGVAIGQTAEFVEEDTTQRVLEFMIHFAELVLIFVIPRTPLKFPRCSFPAMNIGMRHLFMGTPIIPVRVLELRPLLMTTYPPSMGVPLDPNWEELGLRFLLIRRILILPRKWLTIWLLLPRKMAPTPNSTVSQETFGRGCLRG